LGFLHLRFFSESILIDKGTNLSYTATLADNSSLPSWLIFNAATRTFSSTSNPTASDAGILQVYEIYYLQKYRDR